MHKIDAIIKRHQAVQLIHQTRGRIFGGVFIKKDGTERVFNARTGVKKGLKGKGLSFNPALKGLIPVYEINSKGYRMINIDTLKILRINGSTYKVF